jgi:hypothetical protein
VCISAASTGSLDRGGARFDQQLAVTVAADVETRKSNPSVRCTILALPSIKTKPRTHQQFSDEASCDDVPSWQDAEAALNLW